MNEMKTPLPVIMDLAKEELGQHAIRLMERNGIPPKIMVYILDAIKSDMLSAWERNLNNEILKLQKEKIKPEENGKDGN